MANLNKKGSLTDYLYKDERNNISKVVKKEKRMQN